MKNVIYVESHLFVSANNHSLIFRNVITNEKKYVPLENVEMIIFDSINSYFSSKLVVKCDKNQIGMIFCDEKHVPVATLYSQFNHYNKLKRLKQQIKLPQRIKNRLWKKIIEMKINNQATCVKFNVYNSKIANKLFKIAKEVEIKDRTHREAYASRIYFKEMFGAKFKRGRFNDPVNASLNYTYAIVRALIRKELCAHGFEPSIGIYHQSSENPFNLSDDLIEVYRPFVDSYVHEKIYEGKVKELDLSVKKKLIQILFEKCVIDHRVHYLTDAIKMTVQSLIPCYKQHRVTYLTLPRFIEGGV